jgi:hypothetical protein
MENAVNLMMRTICIPKDYKNSPYFVGPTKKFNIKNQQKMMQEKSEARVPTIIMTDQDDVSIEISGDEEPQEAVRTEPASNLEFGCSEIKETIIDNDSSFLGATQKGIFGQLAEVCKKEEVKKLKWKKLPNDFLKN